MNRYPHSLATTVPSDPEEELVENEYRQLITAYLRSNHRKKTGIIEKAYRFAKAAHKGTRRRSGEPYILHPIAVARIVISELGLGSTSICAALLHDVVEDTEFTREDIEANFGPKIANIVDGLTKISGGILGARSSLQAENFRRLLLSMSNDIRVVLIKMADRLHNMRTLGSLRPEKQLKITGETLYVYAPLANRLGLFKIKTELEDLAFRYEHPQKYAEIMAKIDESESYRRSVVEKFVAPVRQRLDAAGYKYEIKARVKSAYSIFMKMENKKIPFEEVYDIYAVRVIFENDDDEKERLRCWEIYTFFSDGHNMHPDRLRDWTSVPKANGYRALHMTAMGPDGKWIEVQIRSRKMDEIAELGYAAHWKYKTGQTADEDSRLEKWMNTIKDILANPEPDSIDVLDTIKLDLYASEIYVFTPKGDLLALPSGATVLDLAFAIHTELGKHCIAGKINHRLVPLNHVLGSGDQVEIITSSSQTPKREWMDYCHSAKAKDALRNLLRKDREVLASHGRAIYIQMLERESIPNNQDVMKRLLRNYRLESPDDLYRMLAADEISLSPAQLKASQKKRVSMLRKIFRNPFSNQKSPSEAKDADESATPVNNEPTVKIDRKKTYTLHPDALKPNYLLDTCCSPLPGDDVFGFVNDCEQVVVHKVSCPDAMRLKSSFGSRLVATKWGSLADKFEVKILLEGLDRPGILEDIATTLHRRLNINLRSLNINALNEVFSCELVVLIDSTVTLNTILNTLKEIKGLRTARRIS
ncbi:MAG: bifunctional (p)ppGpp synthetase/guanosine-3',5'-bis(diphosphate) 3'-pyrophosphohydrolase [Bacteroidales bacterium]|nr:bifunctional (p)ppGpp synthetase/guanosine-3',5'-bis(diphosphate) 3'-pyrophosphohydrolase [Bacteroidales bacterium]MBD5223081.1 bifunctional (p)ppGpp synthetase/guanosine-3',5'-bis(diphosphate) 3'-pyrophosphohydrolase [Bacteroidales bacterium]